MFSFPPPRVSTRIGKQNTCSAAPNRIYPYRQTNTRSASEALDTKAGEYVLTLARRPV